MLTGIATTANFWPKDFVKLLATKFNLYILDYRSFNTKQDGSKLDYSIKALANDTNSFIKKLKLNNLYLLGWSMGGAVALNTVFSRQESFKHLFLISPSLPAIDGDTLLKKSIARPLKTTDDVYNFVFTNNLYNYNPKNLNDETKRFISSDIKHLFPSSDIYAKQKVALKTWSTSKQIVHNFINIQTPTTIFLADNDKILDHNENRKIIDNIKNKSVASIIYFDKSDHAIEWVHPHKLAMLINILANN